MKKILCFVSCLAVLASCDYFTREKDQLTAQNDSLTLALNEKQYALDQAMQAIAVTTLEIFRGGKVSAGHIIKEIFRNPLIIGAVAGIVAVATGLKVPYLVENTVDMLAAAATPMSLIVLGATFDVQSIETKFADNDLKDLIYISEQYLFPYLTYVKEHQHIFMAAVSQPITFSTDELDKRLFDNIFNPILERFHYPVSTRKYVMRFYLNGLTAILVEWLKDGCQKSIEEISAIIQLCIFGRE